jgi:lycopene cyclase domain-containing protein
MSAYMKGLSLSAIVPLVASFWPALKFYRNIRSLLYSISLIVVLFVAWDIVAVKRGHWFFNPSGVWDWRIINLPVEEVLFFVVIPFCCIFTWEVIQYIKKSVR